MPVVTFIGRDVAAGAETSSDLLSGTRVEMTPQSQSGKVTCRFGIVSDNDGDTVNFTIGSVVIAQDDAIMEGSVMDRTGLIYQKEVPAGAKANLEIVADAAGQQYYIVEYVS